jgi:hypothetical protein
MARAAFFPSAQQQEIARSPAEPLEEPGIDAAGEVLGDRAGQGPAFFHLLANRRWRTPPFRV